MKKLLFILLIVIFSLSLNSLGKLRVKSIKLLPETHMNIEKRDGDGKWAPVLIVKTELRGLGFRNVSRPTKHAATYDEGKHEYKFYLNDNQRVIEITHSDYEPLEVRLLADFNIEVNAKRVYEMKLTNVPEKVFINVAIISEPANAEKIIDGKNLGTGQTFKLFIGKHTLKVQKEGYKSQTKNITVSESSTLFKDIKLEEIDILAVQISSVPQGATIYIDNQEQGITDKGIFKYPGTYELKLTKTDYLDIDEQIFIAENKSNVFTYNLTKNSGIINFSITPADAILKLNGEIFNDRKLELKPGKYNVEVSKIGYLPINEMIDLSLGKTINTTYNLTKNSGIINFSITPADAILKLNEDIFNERRLELRPGKYNIEVSKIGYLTINETVELALGKTINKTYNLIKNSGIVNFTITPADAILKLNDEIYNDRRLELRPGEYNVEISKSGYLSKSDVINLKLGEIINKQFILQKNVGILELSITPSDAIVKINKTTYGKTSNIELAPGKYKIEVQKQGYFPESELIDIELNQTISRTFSLEQMRGKLQFNISPLTAKIEMRKDGKIYQEWTGMKILKDVPVGEYEIICKADGFKTKTEKVKIELNKTNNIDLKMEECIDVPNVTGLPYNEAKRRLEQVGLKVIKGKTTKTYTKQTGTISKQISGTDMITIGSTVSLDVYEKWIKIPELTGITKESAQQKLRNLGISISEYIKKVSSKNKGTVLACSQSEVKEQDSVVLTISNGVPERKTFVQGRIGGKSLERIANEFASQGDTFFTEGKYSKAGKNFEEAVQKLNEAVEIDGIPLDNDKISLWLTNAYNSYAKGSDFENAVRVLDERKKLAPSNYDLVKTQAIIYKKYLNNVPKAIKVLKAYEDIKQTFDNQKRIGSYYLALEDYENSLIWYKKAYEKKQDSKVIKNIAILYLKLGDNQAAVKAYEDFIQTNPKESVLAQTYKNMGALYEELKHGTKAIECYEKSNALKYDNNITLLLITKYYDNKYYKKALEKIALLLENKPNNSDAIYYRAMIKFDSGENEAAKADFTLLLNDSKYKKVAQGFIESL